MVPLRWLGQRQARNASAEADGPGATEKLSVGQRAVNVSHAKIRALGEQAVATPKTWRLLRKLRCSTTRITSLVQAVPSLSLGRRVGLSPAASHHARSVDMCHASSPEGARINAEESDGLRSRVHSSKDRGYNFPSCSASMQRFRFQTACRRASPVGASPPMGPRVSASVSVLDSLRS
jgi:hypothetical protein